MGGGTSRLFNRILHILCFFLFFLLFKVQFVKEHCKKDIETQILNLHVLFKMAEALH